MAIDKLNIQPKVDNAAKKKMVQSNTIGANETLLANEVNALVAKTNELVDATNNFTAITGFNFKENKSTYADLASIVDPQKDDAYGVLADGLIYIYNGTSWPTEGNGLDLKLRPTGTVAEGVQEAVSGGTVYTAIVNSVNGIVEQGGTGQLIYFTGTQLPSENDMGNPLVKGDWTFLPLGQTYTNINGGDPIEAPLERISFSIFNGNSWFLVDMGELPQIDLADEFGQSTVEAATQRLVTEVKQSLDSKLSIITNEEFIYAIVTSDDVLLWGKRRDGTTYDCDMSAYQYTVAQLSALNQLIGDFKTWVDNKLSIITNEEFIYAIVDQNNTLLWGKRLDGSTFDCDITLSTELESLKQKISFYEKTIYAFNSPEYLGVTVDTENRIIEAILRDGTKIIQSLKSDSIETESLKAGAIDTESLNLSEDAMNQFQKDLKEAGFTSGTGDWSLLKEITLPIPRGLAMVNVTSSHMPVSKTADIDATLEYYDRDGNYFKTKIILNAQGSSSMTYIKKNLSVDLLMDNGDEREVKFGDWVARDSFHIKAYYIDGFVGQCIVSYHHAMQYYNARPANENRPYKKYYTPVDIWNGSGKILEDLGTEAKCMPDGFPVELYHNGEYYGLYVIALSKHRSNYNLNKDTTNHVFLDGEIGATEIFGGSINWTKFEVRNPNKLKDINGDDYDGDNPKELSDTHAKSAATKTHIVRLSGAITDINSQASDELKRAKYEEYFDVQEVVDYVINANVTMNYDGFLKNWLWTTYDGLIWQPNFYDHDSIFSLYWKGFMMDKAYDPNVTMLGLSTTIPSGHIFSLYRNRIDERYKELRDKGVISVENIYNLLENWVKTIGKDAYDKNFDRWPETPSYRDSYIDTENWELLGGVGSSSTYDNGTTYSAGQEVFYGSTTFLKFKAKQPTLGNPPMTQFHSLYPQEAGSYQSLERVRLWLIARINKLDDYFNYS